MRLVQELVEFSAGRRVFREYAYSWKGRLWTVEDVSCVKCVENEESCTLATQDSGIEEFHCQLHGPLDEVKYVMVKRYTVTIGVVVRSGEEIVSDSMLFPASMSTEERDELINRLLDEADREEREGRGD